MTQRVLGTSITCGTLPGKKDSFFITLYTDDMADRQHQHLLLNVAGMWLCCIMQTLPARYLDKYLPEHVEKPWVGCHLNVALPLWQSSASLPAGQHQGLDGQDTFTSYLQSVDPNIRAWAVNNRKAFNQLRNSPDVQLRSYFEGHVRHRLEQVHPASAAKRSENASERLKEFLQGKEVSVSVGTAKQGKSIRRPNLRV